MKWVFGCFFLMNLITYAAFALDKKRARKGQWRIPEQRLLLLSFFGGAIGGWRGMKDYYHKVNKTSFRILVPLFAILQWGVLYYLIFYALEQIRENAMLFIGAILVHLLLFLVLSKLFKE